MCFDDGRQQDEFVGRLRTVFRQADDTRQRARSLDDCTTIASAESVFTFETDDERQTLVQGFGKRMCRIQGNRGHDWREFAIEKAFQPFALLVVPGLFTEKSNALNVEFR